MSGTGVSMRRTKVICTIGPASRSLDVIIKLIEAGMDVARLNLSHANRSVHAQTIATLRQAMELTGRMVAIMLDTKGPEIRVGTFVEGRVCLENGARFTLTTRPVKGTQEMVFVPYPPLPEQVGPGNLLLLDDGKITLQVEEVAGKDVRCRVLSGGILSDRKKLTLPGVKVMLPLLSEDDEEDIRFGVEQAVDFLAVSFVRNAEDVRSVRRVIEDARGDIAIIAKIENKEGVENLEEILEVADGIMVARGDMGVEYPIEEVPLIQKMIIRRCNQVGKPVVTATQMLESMIHSPRPTRAEASDVANAIMDGTDAVMMSAETASGEYPVEATRTMVRIAERTDEALATFPAAMRRPEPQPVHTVTDAISHATWTTAQDLGAAAIITATQSGHTARMVAKYRPTVPIIAATPIDKVARRLRLVWGVTPLRIKDRNTTDELINETILESIRAGLIRQGDVVVLTAGVPVGVPGSTNLLKVHTVGEIILRGTGVGQRIVKGRAFVVRNGMATAGFEEGDVLVAKSTHPDLEPLMRKAAAVIIEEAGSESHASLFCKKLDIPLVAGAEGATGLIDSGMTITVDTPRGLVYKGEARVL